MNHSDTGERIHRLLDASEGMTIEEAVRYLEHGPAIAKATITPICEMCGKSQPMPSGEYYARGWKTGKVKNLDGLWPDFCPHCVPLRGKRPHNLSKEELRRSVMTFAAELPKRAL